MQIDYYSPSSFEGSVLVKTDENQPGSTLQINPQFYKGASKQNAGYFTVKEGETESRYLLTVGTDSKLKLTPLNTNEGAPCPTPSRNKTKPSATDKPSGESTPR